MRYASSAIESLLGTPKGEIPQHHPLLGIEVRVAPFEPASFQYTPDEEKELRDIHRQLKRYKIR